MGCVTDQTDAAEAGPGHAHAHPDAAHTNFLFGLTIRWRFGVRTPISPKTFSRSRPVKILSRTPSVALDMSYSRPLWASFGHGRPLHILPS